MTEQIGYLPADVAELLRLSSGDGGPQLPRMPSLGITPCVGRAPMWDDQIDGESPRDRIERLTAARNICRGCPVRIRCYAEAEASPYTEGVWAGFGYFEEYIDLDEMAYATTLQPHPD